jgi:hypothetical protein
VETDGAVTLPKRVQPPTSEREAEQRRISAQLGEIIDRLRVERGLSDEAVACASGLTLEQLRGIKKRHTDPPLTTALRLCGGLNVSVQILLGELPVPQAPKPPKRPYTGGPSRIKKQGGRVHATR